MVDGVGAGTVVDAGGKTYVLTAAHVVEDALVSPPAHYLDAAGVPVVVRPPARWRKVAVESRAGKATTSRKADVVWYDRKADLALLLPESADGLHAARVADAGHEVEPGEDCWYCGLGSGLKWNLVRTIVNQETESELIVNGEAWYGHSGSGVFVRLPSGHRLVGVLVRPNNIRSPKTAAECVPLRDIRRFLGDFLSRTEP